jgi:hypothetical protein
MGTGAHFLVKKRNGEIRSYFLPEKYSGNAPLRIFFPFIIRDLHHVKSDCTSHYWGLLRHKKERARSARFGIKFCSKDVLWCPNGPIEHGGFPVRATS